MKTLVKNHRVHTMEGLGNISSPVINWPRIFATDFFRCRGNILYFMHDFLVYIIHGEKQVVHGMAYLLAGRAPAPPRRKGWVSEAENEDKECHKEKNAYLFLVGAIVCLSDYLPICLNYLLEQTNSLFGKWLSSERSRSRKELPVCLRYKLTQ